MYGTDPEERRKYVAKMLHLLADSLDRSTTRVWTSNLDVEFGHESGWMTDESPDITSVRNGITRIRLDLTMYEPQADDTTREGWWSLDESS